MAVTGQGICRIVLPKKDKKTVERELNSTECGVQGAPKASPSGLIMLRKPVTLLRKYFAGNSVSFDLPLDLSYYTPFRQAVWRAAVAIPYGETRSYGWIAKKIRNPLAVRAVGQALGANPLPVIIPCHRVISSSGALGGFSSGLSMKEKLLELEGHDNKRR